jgi:hypothetical protein
MVYKRLEWVYSKCNSTRLEINYSNFKVKQFKYEKCYKLANINDCISPHFRLLSLDLDRIPHVLSLCA